MGVSVAAFGESDVARAAELIAQSRTGDQAGSLSLGDGLCLAVAEGDQLWAKLALRVPFLPFRM